MERNKPKKMALIFIKKDSTSLFSAPFDHITIQENERVELVPNIMNLPTRFAGFKPQVLGSCNGLLWLSFKRKCILWNPASRTHHVLPNDPTVEQSRQKERLYSFHGFGYDEEHEDYKLVSVSQFIGAKLYAQVWVYSLNSDSWKMVAQRDWYISPIGMRDAFVNGSLHWKTGNANVMLIAAFDVSNYKLQVIPKPDFVDKSSGFDLGVLGGRLCIFPREKTGVIGTFRVLEMAEYGNRSSWRELFRFEVGGGPKWMLPITYLGNHNQNQKLMLLEEFEEQREGGVQLICFDLESNNPIKDVQITGMDNCHFLDICVCMKSERALDIDDDNNDVEEMKKMSLIFIKKDSTYSLFSVPFDHTIQENERVELVPNIMNLPTRFAGFEPQVLGSCNGLLWLSFKENSILWNPASRTHHVIPNDPTVEQSTQKERVYSFHGLGYDEEHDDYKLVSVSQFIGATFYAQVWVYSLNSDSWKMVAQPSWYILPIGFRDAFVNGSLHWIFSMYMGNVNGELIAAFNVSNYDFYLIPKPDFLDKNSEFDLGVLGGCLCMVPRVKTGVIGTFRVLEMAEYGYRSSWRELFRFEMDDGPKWMLPITYLGNHNQNQKQVLLEGEGQLICFDLESKQKQGVQITGMDNCDFSEVCVCMESERVLDTVDGNAAVDEMHGEEDDALNERNVI